MDAPHISTLPQDSTPPPVESQQSLMGRFRLDHPPPPPESTSPSRRSQGAERATKEVYVIEDEEEDQLIDDDDEDVGAPRDGRPAGKSKPIELNMQGVDSHYEASILHPQAPSTTPKPRNKGSRRPVQGQTQPASGGLAGTGTGSPAPRKGGRKSKVTNDPEKATVPSNPNVQDSPQANSAMMSAWRLEVAPSSTGAVTVSPRTDAGPSEQPKPPPRKRKRVTKASEALPNDSPSTAPPVKRRTKTSKYIVKEEDGEFPSTFVYQGFPNQAEGDEVEAGNPTVSLSRPKPTLPTHLRSEAYDSASSTPLPPSLGERERENLHAGAPSRPLFLHVERFLLPASYTSDDVEKIPNEFLAPAPLHPLPPFPPAVQNGQFTCWTPYTGPLERMGKQCRRWTGMRRQFKTIGGGSWCAKTWIGGKETQVEKVVPTALPNDLQMKPPQLALDTSEASIVVGSAKGSSSRGSRGGKGGGRGGRTATPQDGVTTTKKSAKQGQKGHFRHFKVGRVIHARQHVESRNCPRGFDIAFTGWGPS